MFSKNILLLDLGSYEIKGILINEKNKNFIIKENEKNTGIVNGYVNNASIFQNAIFNLIKKIKNKNDVPIHETILFIGGKIVEFTTLSSNEIKINGVIDLEKLELIDQKLKNWAKNNQATLLKTYPLEFFIDNLSVENPFGLFANVLKFKYSLVYTKSNYLNNIIYLLEKLNLNIIEILPSIECFGNYCLLSDERKLGSLIFDIGATHINWAFFYNNQIVTSNTINIGSEILTNKIAKSLKISLEQSDKIKEEHAAAFLLPKHFCSWVKIIKDSNEEFVLQSEMIRKILPEANLMISEIKKILDMFSNQKAYIATFCGKGSLLNGLIEIIQKTTSLNLKLMDEKDLVYNAMQNYSLSLKNNSSVSKNLFQKCLDFFKNILD